MVVGFKADDVVHHGQGHKHSGHRESDGGEFRNVVVVHCSEDQQLISLWKNIRIISIIRC